MSETTIEQDSVEESTGGGIPPAAFSGRINMSLRIKVRTAMGDGVEE